MLQSSFNIYDVQNCTNTLKNHTSTAATNLLWNFSMSWSTISERLRLNKEKVAFAQALKNNQKYYHEFNHECNHEYSL